MLKFLIASLSILLLSVFAPLYGQDVPVPPPAPASAPPQPYKPSFFDRVIIGGNFGLQFGDVTVVDIAPIIGYRVSERYIAGVGLKYIYFKERLTSFEYSTHIYGGSVWNKFFVLEEVFLHGEYEILNMEVPDLYNRLHRINIDHLFLGGGYNQFIGENSSVFIMILYNVLETPNSPYENPLIRIGFGFGL